MFTDNKYTKTYYDIITKANVEARTKGETYYECHHIVPKCLGGTNEPENLVLLTGREHFICHWLLIRMVEQKLRYKMQFAFSRMVSVTIKQKRMFTSRHYQLARYHHQQACIQRGMVNKGKKKNMCPLDIARRQELVRARNRDPEFIKANVDRQAKVYFITFPDGTNVTIRNLSQFCKDHNLSQSNMTGVAQGRNKTCKGFKVRYG